MMPKNYYATLGVLPSAEDIVIRAAYRALAQRYHPDKWAGPKAEAESRMQEINDAYAVMSDSKRRGAYDAERKTRGGGGEEFDVEEESVREAFHDAEDAVKTDWDVGVEYFPDLEQIYAWLKKTSDSLAFSYKTILLESKQFNSRMELAHSLEQKFLETYFGTSPRILIFARRLIVSGEKKAAKELNRVVSVLGSKVASSVILNRFDKKYPKKFASTSASNLTEDLARRFKSGGATHSFAIGS